MAVTIGAWQRLAILFEQQQGVPIGRAQVVSVAQQLDALKRLRRNGGARDYLDPKGVALLWGKGDRDLIAALGLPKLEDDEFISYTPMNKEELKLIRKMGHAALRSPPGI